MHSSTQILHAGIIFHADSEFKVRFPILWLFTFSRNKVWIQPLLMLYKLCISTSYWLRPRLSTRMTFALEYFFARHVVMLVEDINNFWNFSSAIIVSSSWNKIHLISPEHESWTNLYPGEGINSFFFRNFWQFLLIPIRKCLQSEVSVGIDVIADDKVTM